MRGWLRSRVYACLIEKLVSESESVLGENIDVVFTVVQSFPLKVKGALTLFSIPTIKLYLPMWSPAFYHNHAVGEGPYVL